MREAKRMRVILDELYDRYTWRRYVSGDPLVFLYDFADVRDREIVALVASSLAYGNVKQIERSIDRALQIMGSGPRQFIMNSTRQSLEYAFAGFKHRWTTGEDLSELLFGARGAVREHGSLEACFMEGFDEAEGDVAPALARFVDRILPGARNRILPSPCKGSACKRLNLFLRWMVREDRVDPGGWSGVPKSMLLVPLDTHIHRVCSSMGMSTRRAADLKTVREITEAFRRISPEDPVKYDFALTRLSMRRDEDQEGVLSRLIAGCGAQ
jgi:uncharacterized protein (TIGR02757 family)